MVVSGEKLRSTAAIFHLSTFVLDRTLTEFLQCHVIHVHLAQLISMAQTTLILEFILMMAFVVPRN